MTKYKYFKYFTIIIYIIHVLDLTVIASSNDVFCIEGNANSNSWDKSGNEFQNLNFQFSIKLGDNSWSIIVKDLSVINGGRDSFDYAELVFDGTDLFCIRHFDNRVIKYSQALQKYGIYGNVSMAFFPIRATPLEKLLWFAFCSEKYFDNKSVSLPLLHDDMVPDNLTNVTIRHSTLYPKVPIEVNVAIKGTVIYMEDSTNYFISEFPSEFSKGMNAFEFKSNITNSNTNKFAYPYSILAKYYSLKTNNSNHERYLSTHVEINTTNCTALKSTISPPNLPQTASIVDYRFTNSDGKPFHYIESSNNWVSRNDSNAVDLLKSKNKSKAYLNNNQHLNNKSIILP